jgi:hypothetical protein
MPEEISQEPEGYSFIRDIGQPAFTSAIAERVIKDPEFTPIELSTELVRKAIPKIMEDIKKRRPDIRSSTLHQALGLYFGAHMLDKDFIRGDGGGNNYGKILSASIHHTQAHAIYYGGEGKADPEFVNTIFNTAVTHDNI